MPRYNPPGTVAGGSVFRVNWMFGLKGSIFQCRMDYLWLSEGRAEANIPAAEGFANHLRAEALPALGSDAEWLGCRVFDLTDPTLAPAEHAGTGGVAAGSAASACSPGQLAVLFKKHSTLRGQHGHGNLFWPCVPTGFLTSGRVNATGIAAYDTLADKLESIPGFTIGAQSLLPCIARLSGPPSSPGVNYALISTVDYGLIPTDRSTRKEGRGR